MVAGDSTSISLEQTPTWAIATLCFVIVSISIILEHIFQLLTNVSYLFYLAFSIIMCWYNLTNSVMLKEHVVNHCSGSRDVEKLRYTMLWGGLNQVFNHFFLYNGLNIYLLLFLGLHFVFGWCRAYASRFHVTVASSNSTVHFQNLCAL